MQHPAQLQNNTINTLKLYSWKEILFEIFPHASHSLFGQLNKKTNCLKASLTRIENSIRQYFEKGRGPLFGVYEYAADVGWQYKAFILRFYLSTHLPTYERIES